MAAKRGLEELPDQGELAIWPFIALQQQSPSLLEGADSFTKEPFRL